MFSFEIKSTYNFTPGYSQTATGNSYVKETQEKHTKPQNETQLGTL